MSSYGKSEALRAQLADNFAQQQKAFSGRGAAPRSSGGGFGARYRDRFRAVKPHPDTVRLIPTDCGVQYVNKENELETRKLGFFTATTHFDGRTNKEIVCSAGPWRMDRKRREPCFGCDLFWDEFGARRARKNEGQAEGPRRWSASEGIIFNVLDYDTYYEVPQTDRKTGQPRMRPAEGGQPARPYTEWVKGLDHPNLAQTPGIPSMLGRMCHWKMGQTHYQTLETLGFQIANACKSCHTKVDMRNRRGPAIHTVAWICSNDACQETIIELATTQLPPDAITAMTTKVCACPTCGVVDYLQEVTECMNCPNPKRATFYDVDLTVQASPTTNKDGTPGTTLTIIDWSEPYDIPAEYLGHLDHLHDLKKVYAPTPYDKQKEVFSDAQLSAPAAAPGAAPQVAGRPYGTKPAY